MNISSVGIDNMKRKEFDCSGCVILGTRPLWKYVIMNKSEGLVHPPVVF